MNWICVNSKENDQVENTFEKFIFILITKETTTKSKSILFPTLINKNLIVFFGKCWSIRHILDSCSPPDIAKIINGIQTYKIPFIYPIKSCKNIVLLVEIRRKYLRMDMKI